MSRLFSPLTVGPLTLRNRIVFSAHLTNQARDGMPTEQHADYYAARAAGGAGLIITEEHSTNPGDRPYEKLIHGFDPAVIPAYHRITEAVHAHGTPILAQLNHNGGQSCSLYTRTPVLAPSPVPDPLFREVPKEITTREIAEVVAGYGIVAGHCSEGGFDGVELQCSQSSLLRGFLSTATNLRTDRYGGSLENRARVLVEAIDAAREALGPGRVLGVRICGDEHVERGTTLEEAVALAKLVEATGKVDYINTAIGVATSSLYLIEASMAIPRGYALFISRAIREAVRLPVVGVGRLKQPADAERALAEGQCDLVGVVRGQIADPDFAVKARDGQQVRACLSCNQECVGRVGLNRWLGCVENPRAGRESVPLPPPGPRPKRVFVVGGGPAGLQAAAAAARRGHHVTLFERGEHTGGQVTLAATAPGRSEFLDLVGNLAAECTRYGVDTKTNTEVGAELLLAEHPDAAVLATGARPRAPYWAGECARVVDVRDVLAGTAAPAGEVVVIDDLGFHQGTSVAELLADRGCRVRVSTSAMVVGQDLGLTLDLENYHRRAHAKGITGHTDEVVLGVSEVDERLVLRMLSHPTGETFEIGCDWVVCATHQEPEDSLWRRLRDAPFPVHRVGDCLTPRRAHAAIIEGYRVGVAL
ncbi:mycofactocin system FadH/OYE family oxidoreductase 2 [Amycolatopsis sp. K13G38]|uniref:Mycofactocin system FadH/OYE family oxidoreductase 2 n=1 Tax=Amycolatopsis acididurans TaxID=2724524 RepID=A0ABX1IZQ4_9PSEU|nr:mycofactocin system FadH/OYE family oxidoreductase 2 [Amycolatopsis acididurans]NKQ53010.1 mycofactocin system FadH/OYE family oxidoreductase 2 [Amycolatopsis acididurans]